MDMFGEMTQRAKATASSSPMAVWGVIIMLILIVAGAIYWWFSPKAKDVTVMGPYVLKRTTAGAARSMTTVFTQEEINNSLGNNFTLSFFVYMEEANREDIPIGGPEGDFRFKPFLYILGVGDVLLDPIHQVARIRVKPLAANGVHRPDGVVNLDVENFMMARWNQITITQEGRSVDIYLNGVLTTSTLLQNLPILNPVGVLLETSPDFSGQAGLFQARPSRLTEHEVMRNYKRNTDTRGKPLIPDTPFRINDAWKQFLKTLCEMGFCGFRVQVGGLDYIDYEFA
ncbi:MAG: hypothetical protein EBT07_05635 [Actinobacteria bacterium]|jgi:hypothetical protein|nr:hypothetical protein [Actinomycetota bacterium]